MVVFSFELFALKYHLIYGVGKAIKDASSVNNCPPFMLTLLLIPEPRSIRGTPEI